MSLQTDLQTAVAKVTADGNLLHDIVHGNAVSTVVTESGPVKTVAKAIADVVAAFGDVDSARTTTLSARDQAVAGAAQVAADKAITLGARDAAAASATSAASSAQAAQVAKIMWQGPWDGAIAYANRDAVTLNGASYVCRQAHTNRQPPNAAYWDLLAAKGDTGPAANLGNGVPQAVGNAATGAANFASREDHVHSRGNLVDGPANATDGELVRFDGATGKLLKKGGQVGTADITDAAVTLAKLAHGGAGRFIGFDAAGVPVEKDVPPVDLTSRVAKAGDTLTGTLTGPVFKTSGGTAATTGFQIANGADLATLFKAASYTAVQTGTGGGYSTVTISGNSITVTTNCNFAPNCNYQPACNCNCCC